MTLSLFIAIATSTMPLCCWICFWLFFLQEEQLAFGSMTVLVQVWAVQSPLPIKVPRHQALLREPGPLVPMSVPVLHPRERPSVRDSSGFESSPPHRRMLNDWMPERLYGWINLYSCNYFLLTLGFIFTHIMYCSVHHVNLSLYQYARVHYVSIILGF